MTSPSMRTVVATAFLALLVCASSTSVARAAEPAPHIVIDPGHGGPYSNANANGLREKNVNLSIALSLRKQLVARGYRVTMTRTTDRAVSLSNIPTWNWSSASGRWFFAADGVGGIQRRVPKDDLQARVDRANGAGADLFISIHNNGAASRSARGTETFASPRDALGRSLSALVHRRIVQRTGLRDRGARTSDFYVCRWANMPAILVEGGFISSPSDARLLKKASFPAARSPWASPRESMRGSRGVRSPHASARQHRRRVVGGGGRLEQALPARSRHGRARRADRWADAPGAARALAASLDAPLLWAGAAGVNTTTSAELKRLGAGPGRGSGG